MNFDDPRLTAMGLLSEVHAGLMARFQPVLAAAGLSEVDFETVIRLARTPGQQLRMSDLAAQTGLSTSGVTRVVDRLERQGLVKRRACASDRRASYAALTEAGRERLESMLPDHLQDIEATFTGLLDAEELKAFLGMLRKIRDVVRPCATVGAEGHHIPASGEGECTRAGEPDMAATPGGERDTAPAAST
ncbi:MarR family winged helix-turn-helix transcriptional regulator [Nonomuraea sp. SYSU D8015]|uniref:MarR family winged helix-turn-helix transcriptional regulator n=1 Tax=Nonomuraea sp. SYSU D8015 TaxID=2593644 RepID=UPI001CB6BD75|nr:MarR family winged helix-turn-helix transcriptional regulator [Nonomuraea sp. SYSU D8015]